MVLLNKLKTPYTITNAIITLGDTDDSGKGRHFKSRFIQPGVAGYPGQFGNVLIKKESLDKFIKTMVGVPVIINHKDINKDNADDLRVGVVNSVWYDNKDGWYWCDGIIWDETAQNLITDKNWSVSCSYDVKTANDEGGSENNIKYDMEFLDGVFTHLALVNNPRYERANIVFNSKTEIVNDKWITVHPNGEENKGRHLLLKDGETPKEAIERTYGNGKQADKQEKKEQTFNKLVEEYKDYFNEKQLKEFKEELKTFDKYKGLENVDLETSKKSFSEMKPEDALKTLKDTNNLHKRWEKEDILKEKFDNYIKKLDIKDNRLSELRRFIGSYQDYFTDKIPTFEEFRDDIRYNFDTDLALKYLADKKGFEHFDNISDREMAKVKSGYNNFLKILGVNNTKEDFTDILFDAIIEVLDENNILTVENDKWITIKGNHILLKDGESIADAFRRHTGVSFAKENKYKQKNTHTPSHLYNEILEKVKSDNQKNITPKDIIDNAVKSLGYSADEIKDKINEADIYNDGIKDKGLESYLKYSDGNGIYKRERADLHKEIINDIFKNSEDAKPKDGQKPTFMILGGRGGSGKSKFDGLVYDKSNYIVLDADAIKEKLPEYRGNNAFEVHEESSDILKQALAKARKAGLNVVLDGTMKTLESTEKKIKTFSDKGYNIEMYYMHLPREKAAERAIGRFMGDNGRYVPLDILLDMKHNEENFDVLKKYATKWAFYNNDVARKEDKPILVDKNY